MDCWITLGIEEYSDKKTIKVAYAKLLKVTKPDDDPQGFKELHEAYKEALALVTEYKAPSAPQWFTPPSKDKSVSTGITHDALDEFLFLEAPVVIPVDDTPVDGTPKIPTKNVLDRDPIPFETPKLEAKLEVKIEPSIRTTNTNAEEDKPKADFNQNKSEIDSGELLAQLEENYGTSIEALSEDEAPNLIINNEDTNYYDEGIALSDDAQAQLEKDWDYLNTQTKYIIKEKAAKSTLEDWKFIEQIDSMIDLEFRSQASDYIFEVVGEINEYSLKHKTLVVKPPILNYLNSLFHWDKKWQHYEYQYADLSEGVLPYLKETSATEAAPKQKKELHYYARGFAFLFDVLIFVAISLFVAMALDLPEEERISISMIVGGVYFLILIPILESSHHQASLGKLALGLRVVNKLGLRLPWYRSFWRALLVIFFLSFFHIQVWVQIIVWGNVILAYSKGVLLQDILSQSYVVKET